MSEDLTGIWQEQDTSGTSISAGEVRQRAKRLRRDLMRRRTIGLTATVLCVIISAVNLLVFPSPGAFVWLRALQLVLWIVVIIVLPDIIRVAVEESSQVRTLKMLAVSTPCAEFYRRELHHRLKTLRTGRGVAITLMPLGALFAGLATRHPTANPIPIVFAGLAVMILGSLWYLQARRETPRVEEQVKDFEDFMKSSDQP